MHAPVALSASPTGLEDGEGLDLTALLELFDGDLLATTTEAPSSWPTAGAATELGTRVRELSVRAAGWGAGPQGAWRAW